MALSIPRRVARFNRVVTNPIQGSYAWLLPPWALIVHRGRRSGRTYRTPVMAYRRGAVMCVVVMYGERSDWVQNVLAGGGSVVRGGRTYSLLSPRLIRGVEAGSELPGVARLMGRASGLLLVTELDGPVGGFGRGPQG